jgi:hypothetical protein
MLTASELDRIDVFLCAVMTSTLNEGKTGSFGGLKVILSGDPLQVLPIGIAEDGFFFQSDVLCAARSKFLVLYLKQALRTALTQTAETAGEVLSATCSQIPVHACVASNRHFVQGRIYANERLTFSATYVMMSRFLSPELIQEEDLATEPAWTGRRS